MHTYANYERGISEPRIEFLESVAALFGTDLHWLLTGDGHPKRSKHQANKPEPAPSVPTIDPDLMKQVARIVSRVHTTAHIHLPADAQATELANAYNLLITKAEDPADTSELASLLPWLETHLTKTLNKALKEPGAGKREA